MPEFDAELQELADTLEEIDTEYEMEEQQHESTRQLSDQAKMYGAILAM